MMSISNKSSKKIILSKEYIKIKTIFQSKHKTCCHVQI